MQTRILIVDDDPIFRSITEAALEERFTITEADSGEAAIQQFHQSAPNIVLLDINMEGMDGYETCRQLLVINRDARIVFISGDNSMEARIKAYEAGAEDFIHKPFNQDELLRKMNVLARIIRDSKALHDSVENATAVAMAAMSTSSELGSVIDFNRRALACDDLDALLKMLVTTLSSRFNLPASAQFRLPGMQKTLGSHGRSSPLEAELLERLAAERQRIFEYGQRLVVNYGTVIVLIKNFPIEDEVECGRIRDTVAVLAEAAVARVDSLRRDQQIREQRQAATRAIDATKAIIKSLEVDYKRQSSATLGLILNLSQDIDRIAIKLGLTDGQEALLGKLIGACTENANRIYDEGLSLDGRFEGVIRELSSVFNDDAPSGLFPGLDDEAAGHDDGMILF